MKQAGIVVIVIGILITIFSGYSFVSKKKIVDIGPLQITESNRHNFPVAPVVGIAVIVIGGGMFFIGSVNKNKA